MYFIDQNVNCLNAVKWIDNELIDKIVSIPYIHRWQLCHVSLCSLYSIINLKIRKHLYNRTAAQLNLRPSFLCLLEQHLCSSSYHIIRYDIDINSWHLFVHMHQIFFHFLSQLVVTFSWMKSILRGRVRAPSVVIRRDSAVISRVLKNLSWSFCRLRSIIQAKKSFFLQRPGFRCSRMGYKKKSSENLCFVSGSLLCHAWRKHKTDAVLAWGKLAIKIKSESLQFPAFGREAEQGLVQIYSWWSRTLQEPARIDV